MSYSASVIDIATPRSQDVDEGSTGKAGKIRAALQARFANGHYRFGEKISTIEIGKEFGMSRQPVMTAMRELQIDGFVLITPQVGCTAAAPDKAEIADFFAVFARMESRMAGMAAERRTDADVARLRRIQSAMEQSLAEPGHQNLNNVDHFHAVIRQMAYSPAVASRIAKFWLMANYILRNGAQYSKQTRDVGTVERGQIVAAIADQDIGKAEALMEHHILGKPKRVQLL